MACRVSENAPEMSACDAMMAAERGEPHQRIERPARGQHEEGLVAPALMQQQRALPEVVQQQRRQDEREPRQRIGRLPKCPMSA